MTARRGPAHRAGRRPGAASVRSAALALLAAAAAAGCGPASPGAATGERDEVRDLELPTPAQEEAAAKLREADVFLAAGKPKLAEPLLRRVVELTPESARATEMLAHCLIARGRLDEADPLLRRALDASPGNTVLRALHVRTLLQTGDAARAEVAARDWTNADPQSADAWFDLGRALYRLSRFEDAVTAFRRAETLKTARADIRSELGLALAASGQLGRAEAKQRDAIDREPEFAEAWFRLGDVIFRRDRARVSEAVAAMGRAVELEPAKTLVHLYLFRVCRLAADAAGDAVRTRGEEAWGAVLRLHGRAQVGAALASRSADDRPQSEFALREQVTLHPADPAPRLALARHLHAERRFTEAVDACRRAIESGAPGSDVRVLLAASLIALGDPQGADEALAAAAEIAPGDTEVLRLRAWVLLLAGRDEEAQGAAGLAAAAAAEGTPANVLAKKVRALARMHRGDVDEGLGEIAALGWL